MIIMLCSQKGGCGKSTMSVNIASFLAHKGKDCILVDSDIQGTASAWIMDRDEHIDIPKVHSIQKYGNIRSTLLDLKHRYEYVIVDSPGRDSREMRTGITAADLLIIPLKSSQPDLDTLPKMREIIEEARDFNPNVQARALLTMVSTNPTVKEKEEAIAYIHQYPEFQLLKTTIHERKIYRDCMSQGKGVHELQNKKATEELQQLIEELSEPCQK